jgi:hypothetical protein
MQACSKTFSFLNERAGPTTSSLNDVQKLMVKKDGLK